MGKNRLKNLGKNDIIRFNSNSQSGFGKNVLNWVGRDKAYPTNVLHLATETGNKNHSAVFPKSLPKWFIELFTDKEDWVLSFCRFWNNLKVAQDWVEIQLGIRLMSTLANRYKTLSHFIIKKPKLLWSWEFLYVL